MSAELAAAQGGLSSSLIELRSAGNADSSLIGQAEQQLALLLSLRSQLATASGKQLPAIGAEIAAVVTAATSTARAAQHAAAAGSNQMSVGQASQVARAAVADFEDDYFKKRKFDPYLQFKSEEEERAFREREAKRQAEIQKALALHTPEGDLRAAQLSEAQLRDAGAHGADRSPDYAPTLEKLSAATDTLQAAIDAERVNTKAEERLEAASASVAAEDAPEIPASVLAALRKVRTPPQDSAGHGLGDHGASDTPERASPSRG